MFFPKPLNLNVQLQPLIPLMFRVQTSAAALSLLRENVQVQLEEKALDPSCSEHALSMVSVLKCKVLQIHFEKSS